MNSKHHCACHMVKLLPGCGDGDSDEVVNIDLKNIPKFIRTCQQEKVNVRCALCVQHQRVGCKVSYQEFDVLNSHVPGRF